VTVLLSWLAKQLLSFAMARERAGDIRVLLFLDAPDVRFTFPGENSWSGTFVGKEAVAGWLGRFVGVGLQPFCDDVRITGWPWNMTVCVRAHDHLDAPSGERVYENRFVIWGRMSWGRIKEYEVYLDTEKVAALDVWLATNEAALMA
jgi:ketosteroid isomerase-like protein